MRGMIDWAAETPRFRELALDQMEKIGMQGRAASGFVTEKIVTPEGWACEFDLYKGATFSMAHSLDQMLHLRPHNRFEDIDADVPGGGRDASGERAAGDL